MAADGPTFWVLNFSQNIVKVVGVGSTMVVFYHYGGGRWRGHGGREASLSTVVATGADVMRRVLGLRLPHRPAPYAPHPLTTPSRPTSRISALRRRPP